jgi:hypothetical protein
MHSDLGPTGWLCPRHRTLTVGQLAFRLLLCVRRAELDATWDFDSTTDSEA